MARKKQIVAYVTSEEHHTITVRAEAEDRSVSKWLTEAAHEKIEREGMESKGQQYEIERRLMEMVDRAADEAADRIVEDLKAEMDLGAPDDADDLSYYGKS